MEYSYSGEWLITLGGFSFVVPEVDPIPKPQICKANIHLWIPGWRRSSTEVRGGCYQVFCTVTLCLILWRQYLSSDFIRSGVWMAAMKPQQSSCAHRSWCQGYRSIRQHPVFYMSSGDLNSDPHAYLLKYLQSSSVLLVCCILGCSQHFPFSLSLFLSCYSAGDETQGPQYENTGQVLSPSYSFRL